MAQFCTKCGEEFKKSSSFCSKCGYKRISKKENELFQNARSSVFRVLVLQIVLYFVYPFFYLYKLLKKLNLDSKFLIFNYNLWYMMIFSIIAGIYFHFVWLFLSSNPKENDPILWIGNIFIFIPYFIWLLLFLIFYILSIIFSGNKINKLLPSQDRIKIFFALLLGIFYFQYKINKLTKKNEKPIKIKEPSIYVPKNKLSYEKIVAVSISGIILLLLLTPVGHKNLHYFFGVSGSLGDIDSGTAMDYQGKYALYTSSPRFTSMDEVARVCGNKLDSTLSLGCNLQEGEKFKIYISKVNERALIGIQSYSVAHEMLHTVYAKMNPDEKVIVDNDLKELYHKILASDDSITKNAVEPYKGQDEETIINELHSIAPIYRYDLPPNLDNHYKKYFKDRNILANNFRTSEKVLMDAEANLASWDDALKQYDTWTSNNLPLIEKQKNDLSYYAYNGNYYAYNNLAPIYNKNIDLYNSVYSTYLDNYKGYTESYKRYQSLYDSLRKNTSYIEAELKASNQFEKVQ